MTDIDVLEVLDAWLASRFDAVTRELERLRKAKDLDEEGKEDAQDTHVNNRRGYRDAILDVWAFMCTTFGDDIECDSEDGNNC